MTKDQQLVEKIVRFIGENKKTIKEIADDCNTTTAKIYAILKTCRNKDKTYQYFRSAGNNEKGIPTFTISNEGQEHLAKITHK
jgi:hypothetical protein